MIVIDDHHFLSFSNNDFHFYDSNDDKKERNYERVKFATAVSAYHAMTKNSRNYGECLFTL